MNIDCPIQWSLQMDLFDKTIQRNLQVESFDKPTKPADGIIW